MDGTKRDMAMRRLFSLLGSGVGQGSGRGVGGWVFPHVGAKGLLVVGAIFSAVGIHYRECPWVVVPTLLLGASAFSLVIITAVRERRARAQRKSQSAGAYKEFVTEWSGLTQVREMFRDITHTAFATWKREVTTFDTLDDLIKLVEIPADLLSLRGNLNEYAKNALRDWRWERKDLLDFCLALYPLQGTSLLLTPNEWHDFHESRCVLSKFWDEWGRKICVDKGMDLEDIAPTLAKSQAPQVMLLSYVEIAYARRTQEGSPGKRGLFEIARTWSYYLRN